MNEHTMRGRVIRALKAFNAIAVENPALPGTPDVNYVEGWIELKLLPAWPAREETPVQIETFTPHQRVWHIRRRLAGGTSWFLVRCGPEWILFDGAVAALHIGIATRTEWYQLASNNSNRLPDEELRRWISQRQSDFSFSDAAREKLRQLLQSPTVSRLTGT